MPAQTWSVPDTELTLTLANRRSKVVDQIFNRHAFLEAMSRYGGIETIDGGESFTTPVRMAKNTNTGSFDGLDVLDMTPQNTETTFRFVPAWEYAGVTLVTTEVIKNQGRGKLINMATQKHDDASMSMSDKWNTHLLQTAPSAGSKDPNSIQEIIQNDPTTNPARTDAIGGISDANTWTRNKATSCGAFAVAKLTTMYNDVSQGSDYPTFIMTNQTAWEYYHNSQIGLIRYSQNDGTADASFKNIAFMQTPMFWEPALGVTSFYFVNTNFFKLATYAGADFIQEPFQELPQQAGKVSKMIWGGQLYSDQRRRQGVLYSVTAPA